MGGAMMTEDLRTLVLAVSEALDPAHQGDCWPDPVAWDGRPLDEQALDLLVVVESRVEDEYGRPTVSWADLARRIRDAIG